MPAQGHHAVAALALPAGGGGPVFFERLLPPARRKIAGQGVVRGDNLGKAR